MTETESAPNRIEILASRLIVKASRRLGREIEPDVLRDAEWPLEDAAPYPDDQR